MNKRMNSDVFSGPRRHTVHCFGERLARDGHLVYSKLSVVADQLPVEPAIRTQRKAAAAAFVTRVRRSGRIAESNRLIDTGGVAAEESSAAVPKETAVPI
jgi:hypothetical protein